MSAAEVGQVHDASDGRPRRSRRVAIIGAGPGGICTAVSLLARGHDDFVILEKASGIGGTWFHNRYPGAECDIKSHLYSFSFAPKTDWTRRYAGWQEIQQYILDTTERFGIRPGSELVWAEREGEIVVRPKRYTLEDIQAVLGQPPGGPRTLDQLREGKIEAATRKASRGRRG